MTAQRASELEQQIASAALLICQAEISQDANMEAFRVAKKHQGELLNSLKINFLFSDYSSKSGSMQPKHESRYSAVN